MHEKRTPVLTHIWGVGDNFPLCVINAILILEM